MSEFLGNVFSYDPLYLRIGGWVYLIALVGGIAVALIARSTEMKHGKNRMFAVLLLMIFAVFMVVQGFSWGMTIGAVLSAMFAVLFVGLSYVDDELEAMVGFLFMIGMISFVAALAHTDTLHLTQEQQSNVVRNTMFALGTFFVGTFVIFFAGDWFASVFARARGAVPDVVKVLLRRVVDWLFPKSRYAERMARHVASLEPAERKGVFSDEIACLESARFPFGYLVSRRTLRGVRIALARMEVESVERSDIEALAEAVRLIAGRIIPEGDGQMLEVASALHDTAEKKETAFLKGRCGYQETRTEMLEVLSDARKLASIVRAQALKPTYYEVLGIGRSASKEELTAAKRSLQRMVHPDRNVGNPYANGLSALVNDAYAVLSDSAKRMAYDAFVS